jgi:hypothetical protein
VLGPPRRPPPLGGWARPRSGPWAAGRGRVAVPGRLGEPTAEGGGRPGAHISLFVAGPGSGSIFSLFFNIIF